MNCGSFHPGESTLPAYVFACAANGDGLEFDRKSKRVPYMLIIAPDLVIAESEIEEKFIRATGPGGQNINKVATAVQLRFDVLHSPSLPDAVRTRLLRLASKRVTAEGVLVIEAHRFRTQEENRQDARQRLAALIQKATVAPKPRRPTKPTAASQARRLDHKRRHSQLKRLRHNRTDYNN